ncbi:hypothetical protein KJ562_03370 [Patescibacteria group bacterium]|nr:hypothetical protein [Patescibacteria group bacterium]MBU4162230.1 hypothetical protein [Patescibacteria group bacterium]
MKNINTIVIAVGGQGRRISNDLRKRRITASKVFLKLNGKPILSHLIDMSLALNFQRVFLLSSYYEYELHSYLKENYSNNRRIIPIYGGKAGRIWGVPWLLFSIRQKLQKPFIYSDGNILYNQGILKKMKGVGVLRPTLANIVLSVKDLAPTHSRAILHRGSIQEINARLPQNKKMSGRYKGQQYCSIGLMVLSESIFSFIPRFAQKKDLDFVVSDIFKFQKDSIKGTIYYGNWLAVHTIQDIDKLGIKS